jgi:hypothetical protein
MTSRDGTADSRQPFSHCGGELVELILLLTRNQFSALEVMARRLNLTISELVRRGVGDFFLQPMPVSIGSERVEAPDSRSLDHVGVVPEQLGGRGRRWLGHLRAHRHRECT